MSTQQTLQIPDEVFISSKLTPSDLLKELAVHLFEEGKISFGIARKLAKMSHWEFQQLLASRKIPLHYDVEEYSEDVKTLRRVKL